MNTPHSRAPLLRRNRHPLATPAPIGNVDGLRVLSGNIEAMFGAESGAAAALREETRKRFVMKAADTVAGRYPREWTTTKSVNKMLMAEKHKV